MAIDYEALNSGENWHLTDSFTETRYRQMSKFAPNNVKVALDIGIGSGKGGVILKQTFPEIRVFGLEAVKARTLNESLAYEEVFYSSSQSFPFANDFFDFIVAGEVIEHISGTEVESFLFEIFRILKPGGVFVLTTPNPSDIKRKIRGETILGGSHVSQHFPRATELRLNMASLKVVRLQGTGKTSRYLGGRMPLFLYGSYLLAGRKF